MEKIPTAEELIRNIARFESPNDVIPIHSLDKIMIEFAKLHVEACKKDIINNVETSLGGDGSPLFSVVSILKSYPLENIK